MGELTVGVNWIAVIVGAVAAFMLGGLWYSPLAAARSGGLYTESDGDRARPEP